MEARSTPDKDFSSQYLLSRRRRRRRRIIAAIVVVVIAGGAYFWQQRNAVVEVEDQPLIVEVGYGDIENAIPAAGSLQPKEIVPIGARASGQLEEILVEVGDVVTEGQLLARIDAEEQALRVRSSELSLASQRDNVRSRESALELARANLRRTEALAAGDAATEQELDNAINAVISAETSLEQLLKQIEQSEANLEQERVQLRYTEITAPLDGTIISLDQKEGATLNASQTAPTVMQIADLSVMTVETEISEADISRLRAGIEVYFTTLGGGDRRWYGELRRIDPMPNTSNNVVLYNGSFDVDNSDGELYPGMTTQVFFVTSSARNVLTVPLAALTYTDTPQAAGGAQALAGAQAPNRTAPGGQNAQIGANGQDREQMRERFEQMRAQGGFGNGQLPEGVNFENLRERFNGGGARGGAAGRLSAATSIPLNEPRHATVQVVRDDGTTETREIVVGASDRVNAEVISGLEPGERVIAGIVQAQPAPQQNSNNNNNNNWRGMPRGMFF
ncbi:MAG: efflux RND transporter periplasmic adaptor subunit [Gammaproteobacteria bacterium]|nr:efflux RND transporter periplasmic adaptor subunit [Gammaproteobacteria bacterium]